MSICDLPMQLHLFRPIPFHCVIFSLHELAFSFSAALLFLYDFLQSVFVLLYVKQTFISKTICTRILFHVSVIYTL